MVEVTDQELKDLAKGKAIELFNCFYLILFDTYEDISEEPLISVLAKANAKMCAGKIIQEYEQILAKYDKDEYVKGIIKYYKLVIEILDEM